IRASAGAILTVPVVRCTSEELLASGWPIVAADTRAEVDDPPSRRAILAFGSEGSGLSPAIAKAARTIAIGMSSGMESLNVAAAATIALVSDTGMPVSSDPGFRLVRVARELGLVIEPIPGPFAGVVALVASGIAPLPFTFLGFTPHRRGERTDFYRTVAELG